MPSALVSVGANCGDRLETLHRAAAALRSERQVRLVAQSTMRESAAIGGPTGQAPFLNGAYLLETTLPPRTLLARLLDLETQLGRRREVRWGPRTLDLDLLLYDEAIREEADLILPHPRMAYRRFVLEAAVEIAPHMRHPRVDWTIAQLQAHLDTAPQYLAIAGLSGADNARLAQCVAADSNAAYCPDPQVQHPALAVGCDPRNVLPAACMIRERAAALETLLATTSGGVVSDFWIEQSLIADPVSHNSSTSNEDRESAIAEIRKAPNPKLVVYLASPGRESGAGRKRSRDGRLANADAPQEQAETRLRALATRPGRGPFLVADAANFAWAVQEATAAMLAMR